MQKWEYRYAYIKDITSSKSKLQYPLGADDKEIKFPRFQDIELLLNQLGADGWEMCGTSTNFTDGAYYVNVALFLKRPIED